MSKILARAVMVLTVVGVAGCSSMFKEPPGITYAKSVEQLGITPVYPPREDIQVGDIWAIEHHTADERLSARSAYVATKNMRNEVDAYLKSRYVPTTTNAEVTALPINGLPQIEVNSGVSIGVGGQPKGLAASLGFAATKTLKMSLQFLKVTSYEVPIPVGMGALATFCGTERPPLCRNVALTTYINQRYQLGPQDHDRVQSAGVLMVTKVYLAQTILYTFNDAQLAAAAVAAVEEDGTTGTAPTITQQQLDQAIAQNNPQLLNAMNATIATVQAGAASAGEGAISISAITVNNITLKQTFARPVVVGYEGVSMTGS